MNTSEGGYDALGTWQIYVGNKYRSYGILVGKLFGKYPL